MKKTIVYNLLFTSLICLLNVSLLSGQTPAKWSFQAVIRNGENTLVANSPIGMRITIFQGSEEGTAVYVETQQVESNDNGLVSLEVGAGNVLTGQLDEIDWSDGPYFMKTETDPEGGTDYTISGTYQLLSVPYALHAKTAENITGEIAETDPVFQASPAAIITNGNLDNWDNAFGWGNHAMAGYLTSLDEADPLFSASPSFQITGTHIANWNMAFEWGNHSAAGYLTGFTETDPLFSASTASQITSNHLANWNNAFGWGNHATAGYLTGFTETDPLFSASPSSQITGTHISNWNTSFGWGNHATAGYLTGFTETDPLFSASSASQITSAHLANWNNAFGWGNHAAAGYLTSFTEADPIFGSSVAGGITAADTTYWNNKLDLFTETDPLFVFSPAYAITTDLVDEWNAAYSWGNHADEQYYSNGGETASAHRSLGNLDAFALSLITNNVTRLFISEGGNIGIGTQSPSNVLSVAGTADFLTSVQTPKILPLAGDGATLSLQTNPAAAGSGGMVIRTGNTTNTGGINNTGAITIETGSMSNNGGTTGSITLKAGRSTNSTYDGSQLVLGGYPNYNGGGGVNLSSGNGWSGAGSIVVKAGNAGWGSGGSITLQAGDGGGQAGSGGNIVFNTGNDAGDGPGIIQMQLAGTEHFRLDRSGKVGIGVTAPAYKLDVAGDINLSGNLFQNGLPLVIAWSQLTGVPTFAGIAFSGAFDDLQNLPELDYSPTNEIQTLSISNDTIYLSDGGFVKIPPQNSIPALITKDDFSYVAPFKNFWLTSITGGATVTLANSGAILSTNGPNTAKLYSNRQRSVNDGKLVFTAVLYTYEDNNYAYGPLSRGLVNGTNRSNAIEFINVTGSVIQARTVAGGVATTTNYSVGASVANNYCYTIIASKTRVDFYFNGILIASHTTNIPTTPLNMYFDASTPGGNVPQVVDDAQFEIIPY